MVETKMALKDSKHILISTSFDKRNRVARLLEKLKVTPVFFDTIQELIKKLYHHSVVAVFVDSDHSRIDVLELILNIRDINSKVPIIIMGNTINKQTEMQVSKENGVFRIQKRVTQKTLSSELSLLFKGMTWPKGII